MVDWWKRTVLDGGELALGFTFVSDTNGAAFSGRVGGHCDGFWGIMGVSDMNGLKDFRYRRRRGRESTQTPFDL